MYRPIILLSAILTVTGCKSFEAWKERIDQIEQLTEKLKEYKTEIVKYDKENKTLQFNLSNAKSVLDTTKDVYDKLKGNKITWATLEEVNTMLADAQGETETDATKKVDEAKVGMDAIVKSKPQAADPNKVIDLDAPENKELKDGVERVKATVREARGAADVVHGNIKIEADVKKVELDKVKLLASETTAVMGGEPSIIRQAGGRALYMDIWTGYMKSTHAESGFQEDIASANLYVGYSSNAWRRAAESGWRLVSELNVRLSDFDNDQKNTTAADVFRGAEGATMTWDLSIGYEPKWDSARREPEDTETRVYFGLIGSLVASFKDTSDLGTTTSEANKAYAAGVRFQWGMGTHFDAMYLHEHNTTNNSLLLRAQSIVNVKGPAQLWLGMESTLGNDADDDSFTIFIGTGVGLNALGG